MDRPITYFNTRFFTDLMSRFQDMSWEKTVVALIELGMGGEVR